jgi:uncharacterized protein involved in exopolysaccharide biosynthesis
MLQRRGASEDSYSEPYFESLGVRVMSSASLQQAIKTLGIYPELRDDPAAAASRLRSSTSVRTVTSQVIDPSSGRNRNIVNAFEVSVEDPDPVTAQKATLWLANAYLLADRARRLEMARLAGDIVTEEAERLRKTMAELDSKLAQFKAANIGRLPGSDQGNAASIERAERDLEGVQATLQQLRQDRIFAADQLAQARAGVTGEGQLAKLEQEYQKKLTMYDANHPDVVSLRRRIDTIRAGGGIVGGDAPDAELAEQRAILAEARERYSDDHPDVRRIMRNIETLEAQINSGARSSSPVARTPVTMQLEARINSIDSQIASLEARSFEFRSRIQEAESRLLTSPEVEREYQTLTRDMDTARLKFNELSQRKLDLDVTMTVVERGGEDFFRMVVEPRVEEEPTSPNRPLIALIGAMLALVTFVVTVVLSEALDHTVRGAADVRAMVQESILAVVPRIENDDDRRSRTRFVSQYAGAMALLSLAVFAIVRVAT